METNPVNLPESTRALYGKDINAGDEVLNILPEIADMSGKILWQSNNSDQTRMNLPMEKLTAGTYMITVKNGSEI